MLFDDAAARYDMRMSGQMSIGDAFNKKGLVDNQISLNLDKPWATLKRNRPRKKKKVASKDIRQFFTK